MDKMLSQQSSQTMHPQSIHTVVNYVSNMDIVHNLCCLKRVN